MSKAHELKMSVYVRGLGRIHLNVPATLAGADGRTYCYELLDLEEPRALVESALDLMVQTDRSQLRSAARIFGVSEHNVNALVFYEIVVDDCGDLSVAYHSHEEVETEELEVDEKGEVLPGQLPINNHMAGRMANAFARRLERNIWRVKVDMASD